MSHAFTRALERQQSLAYSLLRVVSGFMFSLHGVQKILGLLSERAAPAFGSQIWVGGVIELVCGVLIALGLLTRYAAFLSSGTMAVAYAQFHWKFAFDREFFPVVNGGELAALYAVVFLFVACHGAGALSVDAVLAKRK
jgi:putative oxidoreductase